MSDAAFRRQFDAAFFDAWAGVVGGLEAAYLAPGAATPVPVEVLKDVNVEQFGEDGAPIAFHAVVLTFRRTQVEPASRATVTLVDSGEVFTLAQHIGGDESLSRWAVRA